MSRYTVEELQKAMGGRYLNGEPVGEAVGVSIDTRALKPGQLFVALRGDNHDGHDFLREAFAMGASGAVVDDKKKLVALRDEDRSADLRRGAFLFLVEDTLKALQSLAAFNRSRYPVPLIAVTGSNGKTTVKEMTASCLSAVYNTLRNQASLNNHIGVPLTLAHLDSHHEAACIELGMNHPGEIAALAALARPKVGVVNNVGAAHLEFMKNTEGVQAAKGELIDALPPDGIAVLNADDPFVIALGARAPGRVVTFGLDEAAEVSAEAPEDLGIEGIRFKLVVGERKVPVKLPAVGQHNLMNALASAAAAHALAVPLESIAKGLGETSLPKMRMERSKVGTWTVINDAYNANPDSTRAALKTFVKIKGSAEGAFCFGEMREIGEAAPEAHAEVGRLAAALGVDLLVTVGEMAAHAAKGAEESGIDVRKVVRCEGHAEASEALRRLAPKGSWILVKGSRGSTMERVVDLLGRGVEED